MSLHRMVCRQCRAAEKDCQWIWPGRSKKTRSCQSCSHFKARCELEGEEKKEAEEFDKGLQGKKRGGKRKRDSAGEQKPGQSEPKKRRGDDDEEYEDDDDREALPQP